MNNRCSAGRLACEWCTRRHTDCNLSRVYFLDLGLVLQETVFMADLNEGSGVAQQAQLHRTCDCVYCV